MWREYKSDPRDLESRLMKKAGRCAIHSRRLYLVAILQEVWHQRTLVEAIRGLSNLAEQLEITLEVFVK